MIDNQFSGQVQVVMIDNQFSGQVQVEPIALQLAHHESARPPGYCSSLLFIRRRRGL
jgi:hypothetical protein